MQIDKPLIKHAKEFMQQIDDGNVMVSAQGIMFPKLSAMVAGEYLVSSPGYEDSVEANLLPTQALNHILNVALDSSTAKAGAFYLALFSGDYTPVAGLTAATFAASAGELTSNTEGYSETTRRVWTPAPAASGMIDNTASRANFTIATGTSVVIRGAALLSEAVKGSTAGVIISCARFSQARTQYNADAFTLGYRVTLTA